MKTSEKKTSGKGLFYVLIVFGVLIALNALQVRYAANFLPALLKASLLLTGVFVYGFSIGVLFKQRETGFVDAVVFGLIFTTFYFYLISFLKILVPFTIFLFYFLPLPLLFLLAVKKKALLKQALGSFFNRPAKEYIIFLFPLVYASLPSSFYDTLVYHLGIPNLYLQHQGFIATPYFFFADTSIYYEISLIPAVFAGDSVPRLFHFLLGAVFMLFLVDIAIEFFQLKKRFILLLVLVSMPLTFFLLTTVKSDLISAFFVLAGIRYYLKNKPGLSAMCWGFAVGVKYFSILALGIFLVFVFIKDKKLNVRLILIFGLVVVGILLPLFFKNFTLTGNPFFPFLSNTFPHETFDASRYAAMKSDVGAVVHSLQDLLKLPYTLSFRELGSGGLLGAQFLIFLPFIILPQLRRQPKFFLLAFALFFLLLGAVFTAQIRFMYAAAVILAIYTALVYQSLDSLRLWGMRLMKYLFFLIIGLNFIAVFGYHERIYRSHYLYSGKTGMEEYKEIVFPSYPAAAFVNRETPENAKILLVGEARSYYFKRPYLVSSSIDYSILKKYLSVSSTFGEFTAALKRDGIDYLVYNSREFDRLQKDYKGLTGEELKKFSGFLSGLQPVFKGPKGGLYVFKIT